MPQERLVEVEGWMRKHVQHDGAWEPSEFRITQPPISSLEADGESESISVESKTGAVAS